MVTGPIRSGEPRDSSLNYAAIGATQTDEILQYPPKGYRATQASRKIGSGQERFDSAARLLMTWAVQRGSGVEVLDIASETAEDVYAGVDFDEDGRPIGITAVPEEELFAPDGTPYVSAGMTAMTVYSAGPIKIRVPIKVVYVVDEPKRVGFGYGSRVGAPGEFERLMVVELTDDGSVIFTIRAISRVSAWYWRAAFKVLRFGQKRYTDKFLTALHPTRSAGS